MLSIYEYVGKDINRDMELTADVIVGNHRINFSLILQSNAEYEVYDTNTHTLGYFTYNARIKIILDNEGYDYIEVPEITKLNVPNLFTSANEMNSYIRMYNSLEAIDKYRISLKPKVEIININNFMLREFTVQEEIDVIHQNLLDLLKAREPGIWITTSEEKEVMIAV